MNVARGRYDEIVELGYVHATERLRARLTGKA